MHENYIHQNLATSLMSASDLSFEKKTIITSNHVFNSQNKNISEEWL